MSLYVLARAHSHSKYPGAVFQSIARVARKHSWALRSHHHTIEILHLSKRALMLCPRGLMVVLVGGSYRQGAPAIEQSIAGQRDDQGFDGFMLKVPGRSRKRSCNIAWQRASLTPRLPPSQRRHQVSSPTRLTLPRVYCANACCSAGREASPHCGRSDAAPT